MNNKIKQVAEKLESIAKSKNEIVIKMSLVKHYSTWAKVDAEKVADMLEIKGFEII